MKKSHCHIRRFHGLQDYQTIWQMMREQVDSRDQDSADELWCLEHTPVFTQGQAGKPEHILNAHDIPVVQSDRGGQATYHGPGQLVVYFLLDIERLGIGVKSLVCRIEQAVIATLASYGLNAHLKAGAPGVYVNDQKIASLGLRLRKGKSYHGLSVNVDMDLKPFSYINPCGFQGMTMVDLKSLGVFVSLEHFREALLDAIAREFDFSACLSLE